MQIAICPGSYDPVTYGHLNIIKRSASLFDKIIVMVMMNSEKKSVFSIEERMDMLRRVTADIPNLEVDCYNGLVADYARKKGAAVLVKGLRAVTDFEYEFQMSLINKKINPELETMFITTDIRFMYLSSSSVREVARYGGDLTEFVPLELEPMIKDRLGGSMPTERNGDSYDN